MCFGGGGGDSTPAPRRYEPYASPNVDPVGQRQQQQDAVPNTGPNASTATTTSGNTGLSING